VTVLRFFFKVTLDRPETTRHLVFVYEPRKLPRVLSPEEVLRLLEAAPGPKHKAAISVAYGAGLRAMEVVALKVFDIDSKRMMLRVEQGKGRKDRFCHAVAAAIGAVARLVAYRPPADMAVPRARPHQPNDDPPAQSCLPHGCGTGFTAQMGGAAHAASQLCHPSGRFGRLSTVPLV
jgi:integrase